MRETTIVARRRPLFAPNWFHRRMKSGPGLFSWRGILERARPTNLADKTRCVLHNCRENYARNFCPLFLTFINSRPGEKWGEQGRPWLMPHESLRPIDIRVWAINATNDNARCPFIEPPGREVITTRNTLLLRIRIRRSVQRPSTNSLSLFISPLLFFLSLFIRRSAVIYFGNEPRN